MRDLPFPDGAFGAAFCSHVLEHLPSPQDAVRAWEELHRVADAVWVLVPRPFDLPGWLAPDHKLWVRVHEDGIEARPMKPGYVTPGMLD